MEGKIFNIQHFSIHDGPGVRTVVFFKGCNLKCKWCHNPESISFKDQIEFYPEKCIGCGACFSSCPNSAHGLDENQVHVIRRTKCTGCLLCAETCYANAIVAVGKKVDTRILLESIIEDEAYYKSSSGGVTFSGGECMLQIDFLAEILSMCRNEGIHTAVDTAGHVPWSSFEKILAVTDLFLYDVKAADENRHQQLTGVNNRLILENLKRLSDSGKLTFVRIPLIPGCNDDQIEKIGQILKPFCITKVEIIPYHSLGNSKYTALDMENELQNTSTLSEDRVNSAVNLLKDLGINAVKS